MPTSGTLTYRSAVDATTLNATVEMLAARNSELHDFQPLRAFIATWTDVPPTFELENLRVSSYICNSYNIPSAQGVSDLKVLGATRPRPLESDTPQARGT